jgi:hypothetical protein
MMVKKASTRHCQNWWILLGVKSDIDKMYPDNRVIVKLNFASHNLLLVPCNKPLLGGYQQHYNQRCKIFDKQWSVCHTFCRYRKNKITINDIGIGIPPEDIPHLYNRFLEVKLQLNTMDTVWASASDENHSHAWGRVQEYSPKKIKEPSWQLF